MNDLLFTFSSRILKHDKFEQYRLFSCCRSLYRYI